jgi:phage terminase small subunit
MSGANEIWKPTERQRKFIAYYNGNATEAAKRAGYSQKTAYAQGQRLLRKAEIQKALEKRTKRKDAPYIATREERQAFWTQVYNDENCDMNSRLRASELLAKSQADFVERREVSYPGGIKVRVTFVDEKAMKRSCDAGS